MKNKILHPPQKWGGLFCGITDGIIELNYSIFQSIKPRKYWGFKHNFKEG